MALTVGIQRGLNDVASYLNERGYEVVSMEEADEPLDAVVFTGVNSDITGFQQLENFGDSSFMGVESPSGVILVNAIGMSPAEVASILENRLGWES